MGGSCWSDSGGIVGLHQLRRDHGPALEASLQAVYGIDLVDMWRGTLSWRRLAVLVRFLPADCALVAELRDGPHWGLEEHLLDTIRMALTGSDKKPAQPWPGRFPARNNSAELAAKLDAAEARRIERERTLGGV